MANPGERPNLADYHKVIDQYHELSRQNPYDVRILTNLAWAYERAGEFPQAVQQFRQALDLDQNYTDAQYGLGLALLGNGQNQDALQVLERASQLASHSEDRSYMVTVQHHVDVYHRRFGTSA